MLALARSPAAGDRDRLLLSLVDLCDGGGCEGAEVQALVRDVFMGLIDSVERDIRGRLSEKLATASWAPHELVALLVHDEIDIARPLINASQALTEQDLVRLLVEMAADHQIEVARRPGLGSTVVNAILDQGAPEVLTALAGNLAAEVSPFAMERLVAYSQTVAGLRAPLTRHPALTTELGATLYVWVGEALRRSLIDRFTMDGEAFEAAVASAVRDARGAPGDGMSLDEDERVAMDRRVVQKLKAGGQLRAGLLLRALNGGKLPLFTIALAELGDFTTDQVRQALDAAAPDLLALACAAVGVDKSAIPSILARVRALNGGRPGSRDDGASLHGVSGLLVEPKIAAAGFLKRVAAV